MEWKYPSKPNQSFAGIETVSITLLFALQKTNLYSSTVNNLHNPNYSMFKTKTHNAYIIMINKESYIKKKSHNDSIKNHHDSRRLHIH